MKRGSCLTLLLCVLISVGASAQDLRLPRDSQKLIERAQAFWTAIVAGHRVEAIGFILPEKRDLFLSGSPAPIIRAEVIGLDLSTQPERAQIRINIETLSKDVI